MYACPNCGAGLKYDIATKKLICEYCGSSSEMSSFDELNGSKEEQYFEATRYTCTQCGAELVSADNTGATFCSFCGASTLLEGRLSNEKKPDFIIPFSKTKKDCADSYVKMMKKSFFAPDELKDPAYIDGFRGIYMPYWVYDVSQKNHFSLDGQTTSISGDYEITRYYKLNGNIDAEYMGMSHDASYEFADDISEALAPYNVKEAAPFAGSYLSGFYADISDVSSDLYSAPSIDYANNASLAKLRSAKEFSSYNISTSGISANPPFNTKLEKPKYALFPVWFMSYRNNDRIAYVSINGQSGKISADIPVDTKKYVKFSLIMAIPIFILLNFMFSTTAPNMLRICCVLSFIALFSSFREIKKIIEKDLGLTDKGLNSINKEKVKKPSVLHIITTRMFVKKELFGILATIVTFIISALILFANPISDMIYYSAAIVTIIATCFGMMDVMKDHNVLVTRKLPQFNREGGNDSANIYE